MIFFKRTKNKNGQIVYIAQNKNNETVAKIRKNHNGWEVFPGDGPIYLMQCVDTFDKLADAKLFVSEVSHINKIKSITGVNSGR